MQQRGDRFGFVRAVFHRDRRDAEDMRDVGNPCFFPELPAVNAGSVNQRFFELTREPHICLSVDRLVSTASIVGIPALSRRGRGKGRRVQF